MSKKPNATPQEDRSGGRGIEITTTTSFDYSLLPDDVANEAKEVAAEFRAFEARTVEGLAEIGRRLIRVRDRVERGKFLRWVEAEFPNAKSTAYRMMDVAENLASDELPTMGSLPPTTIYQLAAPGTPAPLRQGIIARLKSGERIPPPQIKHMVREARKADRKAKEEARLSPKEKKKRGERESRQRCAAEKREAERLPKEREDARAATEAMEMLVKHFSDEELRRLVGLLKSCSEIVVATLSGGEVPRYLLSEDDARRTLDPWRGRAAPADQLQAA
jgi:hypothetical protein